MLTVVFDLLYLSVWLYAAQRDGSLKS